MACKNCFYDRSSFLDVSSGKQLLYNPRNCPDTPKISAIYRTFYAKDQNAFLIETNEVVKDGRVVPNPLPPAVGGPCSLSQFLEWYNPLALNSEQVR